MPVMENEKHKRITLGKLVRGNNNNVNNNDNSRTVVDAESGDRGNRLCGSYRGRAGGGKEWAR